MSNQVSTGRVKATILKIRVISQHQWHCSIEVRLLVVVICVEKMDNSLRQWPHRNVLFIIFGGPPNECQASSHPNRDKKGKREEP